MDIVKGKIANALTSAAKNHIVATTDDLYDTNLLEYQDEINQGIIETLSGVAKEDTLVTGISNIREDISQIELDTSDLAKENTLVEGVAYIVNKIETTQPDLSTIAKEDTLVAGISDIREDISEIELDTSDLAKEETLTTGVSNIINDVDSQASAVTSTINSKAENIIDAVNGQANAVIDTVNVQAGNVINSVNTSTTNVVVGQAQGIQDNINGKTTDILNTVNAQAQVINTNISTQTGEIISNNNQQTSTITSTVNSQAQATNTIISNKTTDIINTVNAQAQSLANDIVNLEDDLDSGVTRIFDAINLIKEELQGQNSAITLTYLYDTLGDLSTLLDEINGEEMPVEFATDYARQGDNSGATNTVILGTINEKDIIKQYTIDNSVLNVNVKPNSVYNFFNRTNNLTISLETPENNDAAIYHIVLEIGNTVPILTMPEYLYYKTPIVLEADTIFEISILNNYVIYTKW